MKMSPKAKRALQIVAALYVIFIGVYIVEVWKYHGVRPVNDAKLPQGDYALKNELILEHRDRPTLMYPPHTVIDEQLVSKMKEYGLKQVKVEGNGPIIGVNATAVFVWLNFAIVVLTLYGFLWEPITRVLDERAALVKNDIDAARYERQKAAEILEKYKKTFKDLEEKKKDIISNSQKEGHKERARIIKQAREEMRSMHEMALSHVEEEIREAKNQLRKELAGYSVEIARRILEKEIDAEAHTKLIDDFIKELETRDAIET